MSSDTLLPPIIHAYLRDFIIRRRRLMLLRSLGIALSFFTGWLILWCLADHLIQLDAMARFIGLATGIFLGLIILFPALRESLYARINWVASAEEIEDRDPRFGEQLQTLVSQLLSPPARRGSPELLNDLLREVSVQAESGKPAVLLPWRTVAGPWIACAALLLSIVIGAAVPRLNLPILIERFLAPC